LSKRRQRNARWQQRYKRGEYGVKPNRRNAPVSDKPDPGKLQEAADTVRRQLAKEARKDLWTPKIGKKCSPTCGCLACEKKWGKASANRN